MDHYTTLGIDRGATADEIKRAFRKLAQQYHPDKPDGDTERFQEIQSAYAVLGDDQKRAVYDNQSSPYSHQFSGDIPEDLFEHIFGHNQPFGFNRRQSGPPKNKTINIVVQVSLDEAFRGKNVVGSIRLPSGTDQAIQLTIPAGVETGDAIKYAGLGDDSIQGIARGDLVVQIQELPHDIFKRKGCDIYVEHAISVFAAIAGTVIRVSTIDDKLLEITVPPGTKPDTVFSCHGRGLPHKSTQQRGAMYVILHIKMPNNLSDADLKTVAELRDRYAD